MHRPAPKLILIFLTVLLDVLGFGLLVPVAPKFIARVQHLPELGAEHETSMTFGFLMATYAIMQFIFSPVLGSLSDRFGRRPVILISLFGSAIDYFVAAMSPNIAVLFVTRAINGISGASITTCGAYIADITPPEKRAAGFGVIGAAFGLGFMIGPLLGGLLGQYDVTYPYLGAGILTLINWLYGYFILPESLPKDLRRPFSWHKANALTSLKWIGSHRVVGILAASFFLSNMAQFGLHSTWNLSMSKRFHWDPWHIGLSLFVVGVCAAVVQGGLARRIIPAVGERLCLVAGIVIGTLAYFGYGFAPTGWLIYVIVALSSIGGVAQPAAQGIMSKAIPPTEQGRLQGAITGLNSLAAILGPLLATYVFRVFTSPTAPVKLPHEGGGAPFLSGGVLCLISLVPVLMVWGRMPSRVKEAPVETGEPEPGPAS